MPFTLDSRLGDVLDSESGRAIVLRHLPRVTDMPFPVQARHVTLSQLVALFDSVLDDPALQARLVDELAAVPDVPAPRPQAEPAPEPSDSYEADDVARASAHIAAPDSATRWGVFEAMIAGPSHGNPFTAVAGPPYLAEGEVAVVEPLGGNQFRVVGRIRVDGWSEYVR